MQRPTVDQAGHAAEKWESLNDRERAHAIASRAIEKGMAGKFDPSMLATSALGALRNFGFL